MNLRKNLTSLLVASSISLSAGCASYNISTPDYAQQNPHKYETTDTNSLIRSKAKEHFLYNLVPLNSEQIKPYDVGHWLTWNLLGNENNGIFGEDCKKPYSNKITTSTFLKWTTRNPASNFTKYTLGKRTEERNTFIILKADEELHFLHKDSNPIIFGKTKASFNLVLNHYKPFVALKFPVFPKRRFDFYFGWRPDNTFGIKLRPFTNDGTW